jgi:hypothetical protein
LEDITEDALKTVLTGGNEQAEVFQKEITQLQGKLSESANAVDEVSKQYENKIFNLQMDRAAHMLGAPQEVHSPPAYDVILKDLAKGARFGEDGSIAYKNEDGTTLYGGDGKELTLQGRYEQLKADDTFSYLFKEQFKSGGGKPASTGPQTDAGGASLRRSKMNEDDKVKYIAKYGMQSYMALPF